MVKYFDFIIPQSKYICNIYFIIGTHGVFLCFCNFLLFLVKIKQRFSIETSVIYIYFAGTTLSVSPPRVRSTVAASVQPPDGPFLECCFTSTR